METIDDDCDNMDVVFVAVKDKTLAAKYNVDEFPTLMFFKNQIPSIYDDDLENPKEVLTWLNDLLTGADIEQVKYSNCQFGFQFIFLIFRSPMTF